MEFLSTRTHRLLRKTTKKPQSGWSAPGLISNVRSLALRRNSLALRRNTLALTRNSRALRRIPLVLRRNSLALRRNSLDLRRNPLDLRKNSLEKNSLDWFLTYVIPNERCVCVCVYVCLCLIRAKLYKLYMRAGRLVMDRCKYYYYLSYGWIPCNNFMEFLSTRTHRFLGAPCVAIPYRFYRLATNWGPTRTFLVQQAASFLQLLFPPVNVICMWRFFSVKAMIFALNTCHGLKFSKPQKTLNFPLHRSHRVWNGVILYNYAIRFILCCFVTCART